MKANVFNFVFLFFFNEPATTEIYTLSLHDALPIFLAANHPIIIAAQHLDTRLAPLTRNLTQASDSLDRQCFSDRSPESIPSVLAPSLTREGISRQQSDICEALPTAR